MFYQILVLCLWLTVRVSSKSGNVDCDNFFASTVVTINKNAQPYWFQKKYDACIDGSSISKLSARTLHFSGDSIKKIFNFEKVAKVFLDNLALNELPDIVNLPSLKKVSASSNNLTHVQRTFLKGSPATELIFSSNRIQSFDDSAIGENVETLHLTCNHLATFSSTWFRNPAKLTELNLGGNKLTALADNMFKDFINLKDLELRNNEIVTLGFGSISGPTKMRFLQLAYNKIYEIKEDVFGPNISIEVMDVQYNRLSFMHQATMDKLKVNRLLIWGNPWQCPCKDIIQKWLNDSSIGIIRDEDPTCIYAETFSKHCVPFVDQKLYDDFIKNFEIYPVEFC